MICDNCTFLNDHSGNCPVIPTDDDLKGCIAYSKKPCPNCGCKPCQCDEYDALNKDADIEMIGDDAVFFDGDIGNK